MDYKRFIDGLQSDFRSLSNEAKKKHPSIKEAAETCIERIRNIASKGESNFVKGVIAANTDILHPLILACDSRSQRLVQISLGTAQRLISNQSLDESGARCLINEMVVLVDHGIEELRVLQTVTLLLTTSHVVCGTLLAKCLILCIRLLLASGKEPSIGNAASATVRQLSAAVFERAMSQHLKNKNTGITDKIKVGSIDLKSYAKTPPKTLSQPEQDAFMLFQDLCILLSQDQSSCWLEGLNKIPRSLGLDLIEVALTQYSVLFVEKSEFIFLLKELVCPLIIRLFSPSLKSLAHSSVNNSGNFSGNGNTADKPTFSIVMRLLRIVSILLTKYYNILVTECEIFVSLVLKFLDVEKHWWQRALALEVLHKLTVQTELMKTFCENYDMKPHSTKVLQDAINSLSGFIQSLFFNNRESNSLNPMASAGDVSMAPTMSDTPSFYFKGKWIPLAFVPITQGTAKTFYLEMVDKCDPPPVSEDYCLSVAFVSILDACYSLHLLIYGSADNSTAKMHVSQHNKNTPNYDIFNQLLMSCQCGLLAALSTLLEASLEEQVTESILKALQMLVAVSGILDHSVARDQCVAAVCKASLPLNYMLSILSTTFQNAAGSENSDTGQFENWYRKANVEQLTSVGMEYNHDIHSNNQIVAYSYPCPTPFSSVVWLTTQVGVTTKNIQCVRSILNVAQLYGHLLGTAWHVVLTTLQHVSWMLSLHPTGETVVAVSPNTRGEQLTTAAMADAAVLQALITKLFESSKQLDDVSLHHILDALCKLSSEAAQVGSQGREPSRFPIARLMDVGLHNLHRIQVFWKPVTAHFLELCSHTHSRLREDAANALVQLVRTALLFDRKQLEMDEKKIQRIAMAPLNSMCDSAYNDVHLRQLECLASLLRQNQPIFVSDVWHDIINMIGNVVSSDIKFDGSVIRAGFDALQLLSSEFLDSLSLECLQQLIEVCGRFGGQQLDFNISLTAVGVLWNVSDYLSQHLPSTASTMIANKTSEGGGIVANSDQLWLCLYGCLSELCVDQRPPVRKSACQTLFQTVTVHGGLLKPHIWALVLWQVLFPLLDRVRALSGVASNVKRGDSAAAALGHPSHASLLIHHSRDTESKQWAETRVLAVHGVVKVIVTRRIVLMQLADFAKAWTLLVDYIEDCGRSTNAEVSLAALKCMQEILEMEKNESNITQSNVDGSSQGKKHQSSALSESNIITSRIDVVLWKQLLRVWFNIADNCLAVYANCSSESTLYSQQQPSGLFLSSLLQLFPSIFCQLRTVFSLEDTRRLCGCLSGLSALPPNISSAFDIGYPSVILVPQKGPEITGTQQAILESVQVIAKTAIQNVNEHLRLALPDLLILLCQFVGYACRVPSRRLIEVARSSNDRESLQADFLIGQLVSFGERTMLHLLDMYSQCASFVQVVQRSSLVDIVKALHIPLALKYHCPSQSTWQLAISTLLSLLKIGLPVARLQPEYFGALWPEITNTITDFLFPKHERLTHLSMQQLCDYERIDCQVVELIRCDILPYASSLPDSFVTDMIEKVLNRGSIHHDDEGSGNVLEQSQQLREEFAKQCFNTLLQFSWQGPDVVQSVRPSTLGSHAIGTLLRRCQAVIEQHSRCMAHTPPPRHTVLQINSALKALVTLISSLHKAPPNTVDAELWNRLIAIYPSLIDCVACQSPVTKDCLLEALKAYQVLLGPPRSVSQHSS